MKESMEKDRAAPPPLPAGKTKKPYQKPAVRYEKVFEVSALSCGKVQSTQGQCVHNRRNS